MLKRFKYLGSLILLAIAMSGCDSHWQYASQKFEGDCWAMQDTVNLDFESSDTSTVYRLQFPLRVTEDFPFNNIYLRAQLVAPSGDATEIPTEFKLCSPIGEWFSEPEGDEIPFKLNVSDGLRFNQVGKYRIRLYHYMRDASICGVVMAGIALDPVAASE